LPSVPTPNSSSTPPPTQKVQEDEEDEEKDNYITVNRPVSVDIRTPDPDYPIAQSPLWEEVRTMWREAGRKGSRDADVKAGVAVTAEEETLVEPSRVDEEVEAPELSAEEESVQPLSKPPNQLPSRFSDATTDYRYSDATSYQGVTSLSIDTHPLPVPPQNPNQLPSRFSDATSFRGRSRFSDASILSPVDSEGNNKSRFSAWSTTSDGPGHRGTGHQQFQPFTPMEPMPESPPSGISPRTGAFIIPRRPTDLPPPLPPPTNGLPPTPIEMEAKKGLVSPPLSLQDDSSYLSLSPPSDRMSFAPQQLALPLSEKEEARLGSPARNPKKITSPSRRPPPLPLNPVENVRKVNEDNVILLSPKAGVSMAPATSISPSSASRSDYSGGEIGFSITGLNQQSLSASATSFDEVPKSARLPYLADNDRSPSPSPISPTGQVLYTNGMHHLRPDEDGDIPPPTPEKDWSPQRRSEWRDDHDEEDDTIQRKLPHPLSPLPPPSRSNEPYPASLSLTPAITINGFDVRASAGPSPPPSPPPELPLVLLPLKSYIYLDFDPCKIFASLVEVAQGQYGSVYSASISSPNPMLGDPDANIAIKKVPIPQNGTMKISQLKHELEVMSEVRHKHILTTDGLFWDWRESVLWIRMELMDRSLADMLALGEYGVMVEEEVIARFANDVSNCSFLGEDVILMTCKDSSSIGVFVRCWDCSSRCTVG